MLLTIPEGSADNPQIGRVARALLFASAIAGAVPLVVIFFAVPVIDSMFTDFGAQLPALTRMLIAARGAYPVLAIVFAFTSYQLLFGSFQKVGSFVLMLWLLAFEYLLVVLSFIAMFLPVLQLGAIANG